MRVHDCKCGAGVGFPALVFPTRIRPKAPLALQSLGGCAAWRRRCRLGLAVSPASPPPVTWRESHRTERWAFRDGCQLIRETVSESSPKMCSIFQTESTVAFTRASECLRGLGRRGRHIVTT